MGEALRKITVSVPQRTLDFLEQYGGFGTTEAVRAGLERLRHEIACDGLRRLRGTQSITDDIDDLKGRFDDE